MQAERNELLESVSERDLPAGTYIRLVEDGTRGIVRSVDRGVHKVELEDDHHDLFRYSRRELVAS